MHEPNKPLIFDRAGIREVDRCAMEELGIPGVVLMENAAVGATRIAIDLLSAQDTQGKVVILCGPGNNGGDGYAMARLLTNAGQAVTLLSQSSPRPGSDAESMARIADQMKIDRSDDACVLDEATLIVDALLGTGLDRPVTGTAQALIEAVNRASASVLAVDLPSGLDANTGTPLGEAVQASHTATFVGWKKGFLEPDAAAFIGRVHVIDIGVPQALMHRLAEAPPAGGL